MSKSRISTLKVLQRCLYGAFLCLILFIQTGCRSASEYRLEADKAAEGIIREKREQFLGQTSPFTIERPSDVLRRRLLTEQNLPYAGPSSLGTDKLEPIEHWPEKEYPNAELSLDPLVMLLEPNAPLQLSLMQSLQIGALNSFEYQTHKEDIFRAALALDLERNDFRNIFTSQVESLLETDMSGNRTVSGTRHSGSIGVSKKLESGIQLSTSLAIDLANLLTLNQASAVGLTGDATVSIPLLRGSGKHIVMEDLTQAERDVVYAIYQFERLKKTFAVSVARGYLGVLQQADQIQNNEENYRGLIFSARRARNLAKEGQLDEMQLDQAVQNELSARNRWINSVETYKRRMDSFKDLLDLPPDAKIELDRLMLQELTVYADRFSADTNDMQQSQEVEENKSTDEFVAVLVPPDMKNAGPLEIDEAAAIKLAFENRLDLREIQGRVYDAQRAVVVLADALRAELTLLGTASIGGSRSISSAQGALKDARLRTDKGTYSALLTLDLPFERTAERNAYRNAFIFLERAVRDVQILEDEIKISIRNKLRDLLESRQSLLIQAKSVKLAQKRVASTNMFLEADRGQIRDLLEAQAALLLAQNDLTSAIINYRIAELELQRDMGVLAIDEKGLWKEFYPEEFDNEG